MPEVFYNDADVISVGAKWVDDLKAAAAASPLRRSRLRLHLDNLDVVQEMIIALCRDTLFPPHRHERKSESFHMIEGELYVLVFNDDGKVVRVIHMGPAGSGLEYCYRLCRPAWHAIMPQSEYVVFHETTAGPFVQNAAALYAPWAPVGGSALRQFLEMSLKEGLRAAAPK